MKNILKAELFKLKKRTSTWVCLCVLLGFALFYIGLYTLIRRLEGVGTGGIRLFNVNASITIEVLSNSFLLLTILLSVLISVIYAGERRRGVLRNSLYAGVPRYKVFLSKYIACVFMTVFAYTALTLLYMFAFGLMGGWGAASAGRFIGFWFLMLLQATAVSTLVFMLSIATKSTGATIGIVIGMVFFFNILSSIASFGTMMSIVGGSNTFFRVLEEINLLFAGSQIGIIGSQQGFSLFGDLMFDGLTTTLSDLRLLQSIMVGIITLTASLAGAMAIFCKQDQK